MNRDPKSEKGPKRDPIPKIGTLFSHSAPRLVFPSWSFSNKKTYRLQNLILHMNTCKKGSFQEKSIHTEAFGGTLSSSTFRLRILLQEQGTYENSTREGAKDGHREQIFLYIAKYLLWPNIFYGHNICYGQIFVMTKYLFLLMVGVGGVMGRLTPMVTLSKIWDALNRPHI